MPLQTVTLQFPESLYVRLKERATKTNRTLEAEVLDVLASAVPAANELPIDLEAALSSLTTLNDETLWQAAQDRLPVEVAAQLEQLHLKQQREALTDVERNTLAALVRQYERNMLVRARAAALLRQRGHQVSGLIGQS